MVWVWAWVCVLVAEASVPEATCRGICLVDSGWWPSCSACFMAHLPVSGTQCFRLWSGRGLVPQPVPPHPGPCCPFVESGWGWGLHGPEQSHCLPSQGRNPPVTLLPSSGPRAS